MRYHQDWEPYPEQGQSCCTPQVNVSSCVSVIACKIGLQGLLINERQLPIPLPLGKDLNLGCQAVSSIPYDPTSWPEYVGLLLDQYAAACLHSMIASLGSLGKLFSRSAL